jgi:hypothetical protein
MMMREHKLIIRFDKIKNVKYSKGENPIGTKSLN